MSSDPEKRDLVLPERERTPTEKGNEYDAFLSENPSGKQKYKRHISTLVN